MESNLRKLLRSFSKNEKQAGYLIRQLLKNSNSKLVYTEDNIPVYNIIIQKLPRNIKRSALVRHFSKFGQIKDLQIMYGNTRSKPTQCRINYQDAKAAGAALQRCNRTINYQRITVEACPSWEQPFQIEACANGDKDTLLSLNDYCLEVVFKKLDLQMQIRLSLCHIRLEEVFARMICPRLPRHLDVSKISHFSAWEIWQYFRNVGPYLQSLEVVQAGYMPICLYDFMREHCMQVQRFKVMERGFIFANYLNALHMPNITELELYDCDLYEIDLKHLQALKNLQALSVACNRNIFGDQLIRMRKLQRLSLYECRNVLQDTLIDICRSLKLVYLDIRSNVYNSLNSIVEHCQEIETLRVSPVIGRTSEDITKLPRLKSLEVHHMFSAMPSTFYNSLAEHHADDMTELKLTERTYSIFPNIANSVALLKNLRVLWLGDNEYNASKNLLKLIAKLNELEEVSMNYCTRVRDDHVLPLIVQCTKLKRLNLSHCIHITVGFVLSTISILKERAAVKMDGKSTDVPLLILIGHTRIKTDILEHPEYLSARCLLKLSFHINEQPRRGLINEENPFSISNNCVCPAEDNSDYNEDSDSDYDRYGSSDWWDSDSENDSVDIFVVM